VKIVSYIQFNHMIDKLVHKIASSNVPIQAVVPVLRSGMIPAFRIAERLNVPVVVHNKVYGGQRLRRDGEIKNLLLVDDSINSGFAMRQEMMKYDSFNTYSAVVIAKSNNTDKVDFYASVVDGDRVFEWNMFNSANTSKIMFDMDGVICIDPRVYDDDGEKYKNEIENIPRLFVPSYKIHSICTNRIERWRDITSHWLVNNGVSYGKLIMQPFDTAVERRAKSNAGEYKARHYKNSTAELFIESSLWQAEKIFQLTNKPVYCIENSKFYGATNDTEQTTPILRQKFN